MEIKAGDYFKFRGGERKILLDKIINISSFKCIIFFKINGEEKSAEVIKEGIIKVEPPTKQEIEEEKRKEQIEKEEREKWINVRIVYKIGSACGVKAIVDRESLDLSKNCSRFIKTKNNGKIQWENIDTIDTIIEE